MSYISAKVTRTSEPCDVQVSKTEGIGQRKAAAFIESYLRIILNEIPEIE